MFASLASAARRFLSPRKSAASPAPVARPAVERLEEREQMSVTYHGGGVLTHVKVEAVYLGDYWTKTPAGRSLAQSMDRFLSYVTHSSYMTMLGEYGVGTGSYARNDFVAQHFAAGSVVSDASLRGLITREISARRLDAKTNESLYFVFTPPGVHVRDRDGHLDSDRRYGFGGYHDDDGRGLYYSPVLVPGGGQSASAALPGLTVVSSHELAEAVTDPRVSTRPSWYDDGKLVEIADLAESAPSGRLNGYVVAPVWSQKYRRVVYPAGSTVLRRAAAAPQDAGTAALPVNAAARADAAFLARGRFA